MRRRPRWTGYLARPSRRARVPVRTEVNVYPLEAANEALDDLRRGRFSGAAVLVPGRAT
ncbi:hypothetical protein WME94_31535 [Sorangium sp. So ce429]